MKTLIASFLGGMLAVIGTRMLDGAWDGPTSALTSASELLRKYESQLQRIALRLESNIAARASEREGAESPLPARVSIAPQGADSVKTIQPAPETAGPAIPAALVPSPGPIAPPSLRMPRTVRDETGVQGSERVAAAVPSASAASRPPTAVSAVVQATSTTAAGTAPRLLGASPGPLARDLSRVKPSTPSNPTLERASEALKRLGKRLGGA